MITETRLHCPECGHAEDEVMPEHACVAWFRCKGCNARIRAKEDDCCIFCSYADDPCPTAQFIGSSCCNENTS